MFPISTKDGQGWKKFKIHNDVVFTLIIMKKNGGMLILKGVF